MKKKGIDWERIFVIHIFNKAFTARMHEEEKKGNNP